MELRRSRFETELCCRVLRRDEISLRRVRSAGRIVGRRPGCGWRRELREWPRLVSARSRSGSGLRWRRDVDVEEDKFCVLLWSGRLRLSSKVSPFAFGALEGSQLIA